MNYKYNMGDIIEVFSNINNKHFKCLILQNANEIYNTQIYAYQKSGQNIFKIPKQLNLGQGFKNINEFINIKIIYKSF